MMRHDVTALAIGLAFAAMVAPAKGQTIGDPKDEASRLSLGVDFDFRAELDRFTVRGNLVTPDHFLRLWLDGRFAPDDLRLDGRVEQDGRRFDFGLEGEVQQGFGFRSGRF